MSSGIDEVTAEPPKDVLENKEIGHNSLFTMD